MSSVLKTKNTKKHLEIQQQLQRVLPRPASGSFHGHRAPPGNLCVTRVRSWQREAGGLGSTCPQQAKTHHVPFSFWGVFTFWEQEAFLSPLFKHV